MKRRLDFNTITWREYVLNVRAFDLERVEQFEHTRAISYFSAWPYMGKNPPTFSEFWYLPTDKEPLIDKETATKYMQWITEQYALGDGIRTFDEYLEISKAAN